MMMVMIFLMQLRSQKIQTLWGWRSTGRLQVDPAKLNTLKELIAGPDYKDNMQKIIRTIYEFAFMTYAGTTDYLRLCEHQELFYNHRMKYCRPASWSDQEQLNEETCRQNIDGDSPS